MGLLGLVENSLRHRSILSLPFLGELHKRDKPYSRKVYRPLKGRRHRCIGNDLTETRIVSQIIPDRVQF